MLAASGAGRQSPARRSWTAFSAPTGPVLTPVSGLRWLKRPVRPFDIGTDLDLAHSTDLRSVSGRSSSTCVRRSMNSAPSMLVSCSLRSVSSYADWT